YSSSVLKRTSPACSSGDCPGAPRPRAMSASLASARMNSLQSGFAWIAASLRSSDLSISAPPAPLPGDRHAGGTLPRSISAGAQRHPGTIRRRGGRAGRRDNGRLLPRLGVRLEHLVDRVAEDRRRVLERGDFLRPEVDFELRLDAIAADDRRH